ncbi:MAG: hypothetical protein JWM25_1140 [Thermoleophilia bacterium]|nr:hypothetical protein [Thermoleophilia bacterium]MCZ4496557.1 hypothetical protein [Thermoleophilia bacterium]
MRISRAALIVLLLLLVALAAAGCGKDASPERDPSSSASAQQLPEGWPEEIELPAGSRIKNSLSADDQRSVSVETDDTLAEIVTYFETELAAWQAEQTGDAATELSAFLTWTREGDRFTLIVSEAAAVRTFVASVAPVELDPTASQP